MCCFCGCSRALIAGIATAILATVFLAASVIGLLAGNCFFNEILSELANTFQGDLLLLFYIVYFQNSECTQHIQFPNQTNQYFPENVPTAERTKDFLLSYTILYGVWLCASILLLFGVEVSKGNRVKTFIFYAPWTAVTAGIISFDVASSIVYGIDIKKSMEWDTFLEMTNITLPVKPPEEGSMVLAIPSIIMTLCFSKFVVIWLIIFVYFCLVMNEFTHKMKKPKNLVFLETRAYNNNAYITDGAPRESIQGDTESEASLPNARREVTFEMETLTISAANNMQAGDMLGTRDPRYERYLQNLKIAQDQERRSQFPWSYIKNSNMQQNDIPTSGNYIRNPTHPWTETRPWAQ